MSTKLTPLWENLDKGILVAVLIGLVLAWPFWSRPGLPRATDTELHVYRIAELGYSLQSGNLYPRWAPDFYYGHGYPIFNYYSPLTYHLANWLTLLHPEQAVLGAKLVFILAAVLGAWGAYLLGREYGGQAGGLLAATAFACSPYILLINPHVRGDMPEVFALALVPWTLWSWEQLWQGRGRQFFIIAILTALAALLSHNLTGLTTMGLLVLLSLWQWLILGRWQRFGWALAAGLLVVALTAYFWLPFLAESQFIRLNVTGEGHYDFRQHFVALSEILAPLRPLDWAATAPQVPMSAGTVQVVLAGLGISVAIGHYRNKQEQMFIKLMFYFLLSGGLLYSITPASIVLWEGLPGLEFYQFPWRFLGPLAALLIPLVAQLGNLRLEKHRAPAFIVTAIIILLATALPGLYPPPWGGEFGAVSPQGMIAFELEGRARGTTSTDDFIPTTVDVIPGPQDLLIAAYKTPAAVIDRVNRYTLPEGAVVTPVATRLPHNHFYVDTPEKFVLRLYLFNFPGWNAYVDGEKVPIETAAPEGFITLKVPAGQHNVAVRLEDTWPRKTGWGIAFLGAIGLILGWLKFPAAEERQEEKTLMAGQVVWRYGLAIILAFSLLKVGAIDPLDLAVRTSPPGEALTAQYSQPANFGNEILFLGYDLSTQRLQPGQNLDVTLYWTAKHDIAVPYRSFVHLVYPEGTIWSQSDHLNPGDFPTIHWPMGKYIWDKHQLTLPDVLPPGEYVLSIGLYSEDTRLPVESATFGKREDNLILTQSLHLE